jgi:hypothetical protein
MQGVLHEYKMAVSMDEPTGDPEAMDRGYE